MFNKVRLRKLHHAKRGHSSLAFPRPQLQRAAQPQQELHAEVHPSEVEGTSQGLPVVHMRAKLSPRNDLTRCVYDIKTQHSVFRTTNGIEQHSCYD